MLKIGSLFSGIGGLELGLEWSGLGRTVWQVERDEFCQRILAKYWPQAERFDDVCKAGSANLSPVDVICGGFPCQDVSSAGARSGLAGSRSGLWFEFARIVGELRPEWVVVENVASGAKLWLDTVRRGLGELGYATIPLPISAADVGAPHLRKRIFVVARLATNPNGVKLHKQPRGSTGKSGEDPLFIGEPRKEGRTDGNSDGNRESTVRKHVKASGMPSVAGDPSHWSTPPEFSGVDDGFSEWSYRRKALGNAVVPQCAEVVGWVIRELGRY